MESTKYVITEKGIEFICLECSGMENLLKVLRMLYEGNEYGEYNFNRFMMNKKQILSCLGTNESIDDLIEHMMRFNLIREVSYMDYYNDVMNLCDSLYNKELAANTKIYINLAYNITNREEIGLLYSYIMELVTKFAPRETFFYSSFDSDAKQVWNKFKDKLRTEQSKVIVIDTIMHLLHVNFSYNSDKAINEKELLSRMIADMMGLFNDDGSITHDAEVLYAGHTSDLNVLENLYDQGVLSERTQKRLGFVKS